MSTFDVAVRIVFLIVALAVVGTMDYEDQMIPQAERMSARITLK